MRLRDLVGQCYVRHKAWSLGVLIIFPFVNELTLFITSNK